MKKFNRAVCGGTFDYLHLGHKKFLEYIAHRARIVSIGLTSDIYVLSLKSGKSVRPYEVRKKELTEFIQYNFSDTVFEIISIDNLYGPLSDELFSPDAIFITPETKKGAVLINKKRKEKGLQQLSIVEFPFVLAEDFLPISSTRIRDGEISREGIVFLKKEMLEKNSILPQKLRAELQKPFGELILDFDSWLSKKKIEEQKSITVGDIVTKTLHEAGYDQKLSIVDFFVERKETFRNISELGFQKNTISFSAENKAGTISSQVLKTLKKISQNISNFNNPVVVVINGEEDLVVIPAVLAAPLGFSIFYGQPGNGVVKVEVTESTKEKAYSMINRFDSLG